MIPAGTYQGRAIAGSEQYGVTSNGTDQIAIDLEIQTESGVAKATTFLFFSEKAAPYSIERLRALGWQGDDLSRLDGIDANEVPIAVKYEMYNGEQKMKVDIVTGGSVVLQNTMSEQQKRQFAARFKGALKGSATPARPPSQPRAAAPAQRTPPRAAPAHDDAGTGADEIPF